MSIVGHGRRIAREVRRQDPRMRRSYLRSRLDGRVPTFQSVRLLRAVAGISKAEAGALLAEPALANAHAIAAAGEATYEAEMPSGYGAGTLKSEEGAVLYALLRALAPGLVVETGTANGSSTLYLLSALERNGAGRLISIDLPFVGADLEPVIAGTSIGIYDSSPLPPGRESGWLVPAELRDRWELRLGDARELLDEIDGEIDIFFHDSLHTREHMLAEFRTAWPKLSPRGLIAADDIFQRRHDALAAFAAEVSRPFYTFRNLGFIPRYARP